MKRVVERLVSLRIGKRKRERTQATKGKERSARRNYFRRSGTIQNFANTRWPDLSGRMFTKKFGKRHLTAIGEAK